jgi:hypothetical protein
MYPTTPSQQPNSSKHQFEDIIVDEKASGTIRDKLECLAVVHRSLLFINL